MRACFAILKDSFREAAASRVLWIALIAIVVVLLALAPLGLTTVPSTQLRPYELVDTEAFLRVLAESSKTPETPSAHLWSLLTEQQKSEVGGWLKPGDSDQEPPQDRRGPPRRGRIQTRVLDLINPLLKNPQFYRAESWAAVKMDEDLRAPDDASLAADTLAARNLKRLAGAFPQSIEINDELSLSLTYGSMILFGPLRAPPVQTGRLIDETIIGILSVFLGFFGIFSSLLVTSTIIPRTFEPGEISLLLSKPARRSVLFVTKFFGGCAFTFLCAAVLVSGVWLLLWIRFGFWRPELLLCIPLYVFLFAIYFSVSALAGAIWKNATVSLILVVVFWVVVTTTGAIHGFMSNVYIRSQQIVEVAAAGDEIFVVDGSKAFSRWDSANSDWETVFEYDGGNSFQQAVSRMFGSAMRIRPVASPDGERLLALQPEFSRFGGAAPATLVSGDKDNNFAREAEWTPPEPIFAVFLSNDGRILLPGTRSVYQYLGVSEQVKDTQAWFKKVTGGLYSPSTSQGFDVLTSGDLESLRPDASVAFNGSDNTIVTWNNGKLTTMVQSETGKYSVGTSRSFDKAQSAVIATGGQFVLCALADGNVILLDRMSLETIAEALIPDGDKPKTAEFAADGSWGVVMTHGGDVITCGGKEREFLAWKPPGVGAVSAVNFDADGQLIVADGRRSLQLYDSTSRRPVKTIAGQLAWPYRAYDLVLFPLYKMLPKPSELDNAVRYLVTGEKTVAVDANQAEQPAENLNQQRITFDLWTSFWSNLGFIAVMLAAGCVYLIRRDF